MKNIGLLSLLFLLSCGAVKQSAIKNSAINVMTFNIRYDNPEDSLNNWQYRKDRVARAIRFYEVDVLGTQEVLHNQLEEMKERLPGYHVLGVGREDGKQKGEYSALWFRKERFLLLDSGNFWLSETPEVVGSKGWDGACERIATWAKLRDKTTKKELLVVNTHFDHRGVVARRESVKLLLDRISKLANGCSVVVTGDFNAEPDSEVYYGLTNPSDDRHLMDARSISPIVYGPSWSWHDFGKLPFEERPLIDYVFVRNGVRILKYGVLAEMENQFFLSDHAPILVKIECK